jgi:glycosyltransferase involved in cell wall biosynthesis
VATTGGAIPEAVPESAGLLVPPNDAAAFAEALRRMITDAALRAALAEGSKAAGAALTGWADTAAAVAAALERI